MKVYNLVSMNSPSMQARKLVPISEYKGTLLKLTAGDKRKISDLQTKRAQYELELMNLIELTRKNGLSNSEQFYYDYKIFKIKGFLSECDNLIKAVKLARLRIQQGLKP